MWPCLFKYIRCEKVSLSRPCADRTREDQATFTIFTKAKPNYHTGSEDTNNTAKTTADTQGNA
jgi:hypothetical protein